MMASEFILSASLREFFGAAKKSLAHFEIFIILSSVELIQDPLSSLQFLREPLNSGKLCWALPKATKPDRESFRLGALAYRSVSWFFR